MRYAVFSFARNLLGGLLLALAGLGVARAQVAPADSLPGISRALARYYRQAPTEQLYLHLDRPAYLAGETIWLQAYAVDGTLHRPLPLSKIAYVELLNAQQQPVLQLKLALRQATGHGSLTLPDNLPAGGYVLRAYTRWMQNFRPDFYFHCPLTILNPRQPRFGPPPAPVAYDAQFFAEGGQLVAGLPGRVGLRVAGSDGRGVAATGTVHDAHGQVVATFATLKHGLGSFELTPAEAGAGYVATVQPATGPALTVPLPAVQPSGYALALNELDAQHLRLTIRTQGNALAAAEVAVLAHAGAYTARAVSGRLYSGRGEFVFDKAQLPDGITHFTVFDAERRPRCERLYFQRPRRPLALAVQASQPTYQPRQRVELQVRADAPAATASLAVYQLDSLTRATPPDIGAYLLLAGELRGPIEDAGYYLRDSSTTARLAADHLMLTQGWSRWRWDDVLAQQPVPLPYPAELNGHFVRGRLTDRASGAPVAGVAAYLASPSKTIRLYNTLSQPDGSLLFETNLFYGPAQLVLQTDWRRDSTYHLELQSPFSARYAPSQTPALTVPPMLATALSQRYVQVQAQQRYQQRFEHPYLQPAHDTVAFYGRPDERYLLDDYTRFPVLEEVMREYVPGVLVRKRRDGFHFRVVDKVNEATFRADPLVLLDGIPIFSVNQIMEFSPLKIRKLDVVTQPYYHGQLTYEGIVSYTTYKGDLGGYPLSPRALLEEYEGVQGEREFFAPRYETADAQASPRPDFRNLLHWQPELHLQAGQPLPISFYTSDQVGRYLVVVQALARNGRPGTTTLVLDVKPAL